jgi:hypothetical protein
MFNFRPAWKFNIVNSSFNIRSFPLRCYPTMQIFSWAMAADCSKSSSSKAGGESKPEGYPQGYVEDFDESRTKLADFFSSLR